ncbi:MAG: AMP-binding protein [Henriciella sp.]
MLEIPNVSMIELIDEACDRNGDALCLKQGALKISYNEVETASVKAANAFIEAGLTKGFRCAFLTPNDAMSVAAILGVIRAGGVWMPLNPRNSLQENVDLLVRFGCDVLILHSSFEHTLEAFQKALPNLELIKGLDEACQHLPSFWDWAKAAPQASEYPKANPEDLVFTPTTGGTSGAPKAVGISNRNFVAVLVNHAHASQDRPNPISLAAAPMTHVGGRIVFAVMVRDGVSIVLTEIDPQTIMKTIETERISEMFLPPSAIYTLLDQPNVKAFDYSSLRAVAYGSAPMSIARLKEAISILGPVMIGGFGQTECPMSIAEFKPAEHFVDQDITGDLVPDSRLRSCGRATAISTLAILDEEGQELPTGERGEIAVKGPMVMEGYVDNPEETAKTRCNGWHLTGDIGFLDEDGYLYIVDRKKDMIVSGGFNIYSAEVEGVISALEGVIECAVIGVPDDRWGEAVKAVVRLSNDTSLSEADIIAVCKEKLGSVKAPKSVEFVDDFPRSTVGKILKRNIREPYWQGRSRRV